jgi:transposase
MRPTAYRRNARGLRDRQAFEHIRMQAGALFASGHTQAEVAHKFGVARQVVSRRHARWRQGGLPALRSAGTPRGCPTSNCTVSTRRYARVLAPTGSTLTTGPWRASPP